MALLSNAAIMENTDDHAGRKQEARSNRVHYSTVQRCGAVVVVGRGVGGGGTRLQR